MSARFRRRVIDLEGRLGSARHPVPRPCPGKVGGGGARCAPRGFAAGEAGRARRRAAVRGEGAAFGLRRFRSGRVAGLAAAYRDGGAATGDDQRSEPLAAVDEALLVSARSALLAAADGALLVFMVLLIQPA